MKTTILATLLALVSFSSHAAIYKCTNSHGRTIYQDKPCKQEIKLRSEEDVRKAIKLKAKKSDVKKSSKS